MNSFSKFIAALSALIVSVAILWIALVTTGAIPRYKAQIEINHGGNLNLLAPLGGFGQ